MEYFWMVFFDVLEIIILLVILLWESIYKVAIIIFL